MALVNVESAQKEVLSRLGRLAPRRGVELLSYKRNRGVSFFLRDDGAVLVRQRGYVSRELVVEMGALPRLLKTITAREFPRSQEVQ